MSVTFLLCILFLVILFKCAEWGIKKESVISRLEEQYKNTLLELKKHPNDPDIRITLVETGRQIQGLKLPNDNSYSESRISNDISAATAGSTIGEGNFQKIRINTSSVTDEINGLAELVRRGVISADEFEIGKNNLLGNKTDKIDEKTKSLESLYHLKKQGAITDGEYNMKKWDILSKK